MRFFSAPPFIRRNVLQAGGVFYDVSGFISDPRRTGIQRVMYEILRNWTGSSPLIPGFIHQESGKATLLPSIFYDLISEYFSGAHRANNHEMEEKIRKLAYSHFPVTIKPDQLNSFRGFLNVESFHDPKRITFYDHLLDRFEKRVHWVVHDALLWQHPEYFPPKSPETARDYLRILRRIPNIHFVSPDTKQEFYQRGLLTERSTYRVCLLGSDGFGRAKPALSCPSRRFTYFGTIEPRKHHRKVLDAFDDMWARGINAELCFSGKLGWDAAREGWLPNQIGTELESRGACSACFKWHRDLPDAVAREIIISSRATIYASEAEGYGLPPLESLALGVPVIASAALPSLKMLPEFGQIRLPVMSARAISNAVLQLLHEEVAAQKRTEISALHLPTWRSTAESLRAAIVPEDST